MQNSKKRKHEQDNGFEQWGGYMNAKISKLEVQFEEEKRAAFQKYEKINDIFKGIAIFVNGYTDPSADELRCLMLLHGGVYHHYFRPGKTTHIIASTLPNTKFDQMKNFNIVRCEWITESIKAGKLLNYKNYLLQNNFLSEGLQLKREEHSSYLNTFTKDSWSSKLGLNSKTAADKEYLCDFYNNSRLHFISFLGNELKQYVNEMRIKHNGVFLKRKIILDDSKFDFCSEKYLSDESVIMHIDMDCFFVSVALRNYPELKGQPVAVTHCKNNTSNIPKNSSKESKVLPNNNVRESKIKENSDIISESNEKNTKEVFSMSEIASCSYEARRAGIYKGMYLGSALKLCPNLKTISYDFEGYKEVSRALYDIVAQYTLDIEAVSCDELYIDCNSLLTEVRISPEKFANILKQEIEQKTKCTSTVGIGKNKLLARLATKHVKPNGLFYLTSSNVDDFMQKLSIHEIPGIGRSIGKQLKKLNVESCGDLQKFSMAELKKEFGIKIGEKLYKYCRGINDEKVNFEYQRKSVSAEVNYGIRFNNESETEKFLKELSEEVSKRLKNNKMMGKNITLKIMYRSKNAPVESAKYLGHGECDSISRSTMLPSVSDDPNVISKHVIFLFHVLGIPAHELRGIGIQVTKLESANKTCKTLQSYFSNHQQIQKNDDINVDDSSQNSNNVTNQNSENEVGWEKKNWLAASQVNNENLKLEVLNKCTFSIKNLSNNTKKNTSKVIHSIEANYATQSFLKLSVEELKTMIKKWVMAEGLPQSFDIEILELYFKNLIEKKNLEIACTLIRCMYRHIKAFRKNNENWHNIYVRIVDVVQSASLNTFKRNLSSKIILNKIS